MPELRLFDQIIPVAQQHDAAVFWIDNADDLATAISILESAELLALDTEFIRVGTFYPSLALIQIYDGRQCFLIDPLAELDLTSLTSIFLAENCVKAMHAASEDIEIFHMVGLPTPTPLFDTQLAELFDPSEAQGAGLQALVSYHLQIDIDKGETRSDWLQRPLSAAQLNYAVADVIYLFALAAHRLDTLSQDAGSQRRLALCFEEAQQRYPVPEKRRNAEFEMKDFKDYYLGMRKAFALPPPSQRILQELAAWREVEARERNIARKKICDDDLLMVMAKEQIHAPDGLHRVRRMGQKFNGLRRYGPTLVALTAKAMDEGPGEAFRLITPPLPKSFKQVVKQVKAHIAEVAAREGIAPEILAGRKQIEELVLWVNRAHIPAGVRAEDGDAIALTSGWRGDLLMPDIIEISRLDASSGSASTGSGTSE
ncbi:ribonuclease D [Allohahella marinimesophila]|uniref:Ribonuclease D n=1 Tax=Allohahella marinimesophila TaxID=1054972 RepID=A0ABP7PF17_9GAMM